ncbi:MAG: hypothetical protein V7749_14415 [Cocleimonas sp.]
MAFLALSNIFELVIRFFLIYVITSSETVDFYGEYSINIVLSQFLVFIFMFGLGPGMVRASATKVNAVLGLKILSVLLGLTSGFIIYFVYDMLLFSIYMFYYYITLSSYICTADSKPKNVAKVRGCVYLVLFLSVVSLGGGYDALVFSYGLCSLGVFILVLLNIDWFENIKFDFDFKYLVKIYVSQVSTFGLKYFERFLFSNVMSNSEFGLYSLIRDVVNALCYVLYFPLQVFWIKDIIKRKLEGKVQGLYFIRIIKYLIILSFLLCLGVVFLGIIKEYLSGIPIVDKLLSINLWYIIAIVILEVMYRFIMVMKDADGEPEYSVYLSIVMMVTLYVTLLLMNITSVVIAMSIVSLVLIFSYVPVAIFFLFYTYRLIRYERSILNSI